MSSKCILCDNGYDFRKIQVNEILGTVGIALASSLNSVTKAMLLNIALFAVKTD